VVPLRSSSCPSPDPVTSEPFPSAFTTVAFGQSRRRWFGTYSCKPVPRGRPSSVEQLRTSSAFQPFAVLVAHYNRETVKVNLPARPDDGTSPHAAPNGRKRPVCTPQNRQPVSLGERSIEMACCQACRGRTCYDRSQRCLKLLTFQVHRML
jgi:hypothetical protein